MYNHTCRNLGPIWTKFLGASQKFKSFMVIIGSYRVNFESQNIDFKWQKSIGIEITKIETKFSAELSIKCLLKTILKKIIKVF